VFEKFRRDETLILLARRWFQSERLKRRCRECPCDAPVVVFLAARERGLGVVSSNSVDFSGDGALLAAIAVSAD
jgi:hypothetical protein